MRLKANQVKVYFMDGSIFDFVCTEVAVTEHGIFINTGDGAEATFVSSMAVKFMAITGCS